VGKVWWGSKGVVSIGRAECLRTGRFFCKFPGPIEASTRIRLSICTNTHI
jgi:hypothetical protein